MIIGSRGRVIEIKQEFRLLPGYSDIPLSAERIKNSAQEIDFRFTNLTGNKIKLFAALYSAGTSSSSRSRLSSLFKSATIGVSGNR